MWLAESGGNNLQILAADGKLGNFSKELTNPSDRVKHRAMFCFRWLVSALCKRHGFKVVLVDLGPSNDLLNRMVMNSCDVILPSFRPDYYGWSCFNQLLIEGDLLFACVLGRQSGHDLSSCMLPCWARFGVLPQSMHGNRCTAEWPEHWCFSGYR